MSLFFCIGNFKNIVADVEVGDENIGNFLFSFLDFLHWAERGELIIF